MDADRRQEAGNTAAGGHQTDAATPTDARGALILPRFALTLYVPTGTCVMRHIRLVYEEHEDFID